MPTINKLQKTKKVRTNTPIRDLRETAYHTSMWQKAREYHLKRHPLCEECLKTGKITPATSVHHLSSPFEGGEINWTKLTDDSNLMSICHECHGRLHTGARSPQEIIKELDELLGGEIVEIRDKDKEKL